jgi:hypothetical protein
MRIRRDRFSSGRAGSGRHRRRGPRRRPCRGLVGRGVVPRGAPQGDPPRAPRHRVLRNGNEPRSPTARPGIGVGTGSGPCRAAHPAWLDGWRSAVRQAVGTRPWSPNFLHEIPRRVILPQQDGVFQWFSACVPGVFEECLSAAEDLCRPVGRFPWSAGAVISKTRGVTPPAPSP